MPLFVRLLDLCMHEPGLYMAGASFVFFVIARDYFNLHYDTIASMMFVQIATGLQFSIFSCRVESASFVTHAPSIYLFVIVFTAQFIVALLAVYGSVSWRNWSGSRRCH